MFCVLYFSALLFWFFQSTNLFVAYYSDKFNSTEKGPAQLILSHPRKSAIFVLFFNLAYPQALAITGFLEETT